MIYVASPLYTYLGGDAMKNKSRLTATLIVTLFLISGSAQINRAGGYSPVTAFAPSVTTECADDIEDIDHCPDTGCGELGDAELNKAKNIESMAGAVSDMTIAQIKAIKQPSRFDTGSPRNSIKTLGEGNGVRVMGFLLRVKAQGGESCNCGLTTRAQTDVHLALTDDPDEAETDSITAEITPRVRLHQHLDPKWQFKNVNDIEGSFVRITGLLMLDTKHIRQSHLLPKELPNHGLTRATNWEVHPIFKLEECVKSLSACKKNRPGAWQDFK